MVDDNELQEPPPPPLNETIPAGKKPEIREWYLPDELTKLILVRLPANELIGCKLVSKLWLSLISSPDFISDHSRRSKTDPSNHLLLFHYVPPCDSLDPPPGFFRSIVYFICPYVSVIGSVNGLICIVGKSVSDSTIADDIWILNPVTRHIMKIPSPDVCLDSYEANRAYFVFWWDSITGDGDDDGEYKLAKIVPNSDDMITLAYVWVSSSPETWSEIPVGFRGSYSHPSLYASGCDIVVGGFAYWLVFNVGNMFVLSLDLKTLSLSLRKSPFPQHPVLHYTTSASIFETLVSNSNNILFAANWKGKFALAERVDGPKMYDVWTMDAVDGWNKECSFDYPVLKWIDDVNGKTLVMITENPVYGENGITSYDIGWGGSGLNQLECGIALYDIGTGEAEPIKDFISGHLLASAHDFVGSLVSIKGFKPLEADDDLSPHLRVVWPDPSAASDVLKKKQKEKKKKKNKKNKKKNKKKNR